MRGDVTDARGKPDANALVWIQPSVTTGVVQVRTDAHGKYEATNLPDIPYNAFAWTQVEYDGQEFCLRLAADDDSQDASFTPKSGVLRDFKWKLSGRLPDMTALTDFFGDRVQLTNGDDSDGAFVDEDDTVEVTFEPTQPLADGSAGTRVQKRVSMNDVPLGTYRVTAHEVHDYASGEPLLIGTSYGKLGESAKFKFKPTRGCGGQGSGIARGFLYVAHAPR
ncbi:carboxypeptidase family protein [Deinococcus yavapaiensis KR-236]|uniref:Carboxypeptidase family protein n=1 Tax=Deinococcus yavapaiensis KR-236 TaxID=694435 RepID=A0A318S570_9DEIO|nr:carboxypeptidase family protein [Deinococcus yavapaiensis KR-236]